MTSLPLLPCSPSAAGDESAASAADALERMEAADALVRAAEVQRALAVLAWVDAHPADALETGAHSYGAARGGERGMPLGGPGCPVVVEFCLAEVALALAVSTESARLLAGELLELRHRLPRVWSRVLAGEVPLWRARRIAALTQTLPADAAATVDHDLAGAAGHASRVRVAACVEAARAVHDPAGAQARAAAAAEARQVVVDHQPADPDRALAGLSEVHACLDTPDALDLDAALRAGAHALAACGSTQTLDVRRAQALGLIARGQLTLDLALLETGDSIDGGPDGLDGLSPGETVDVVTGEITAATSAAHSGVVVVDSPVSREIVLHLHLTPGAPTADAEGPCGQRLLHADAVRAWCAAPATTRITVRPVLDPLAGLVGGKVEAVDSYTVPDRIREAVLALHPRCVFPGCQRPARSGDLDHTIPYLPPETGGPPGQTRASNLAPLCRWHHRLKTHGRWTYHRTGPTTFTWTGPHGQHHTVDTRPPPTRKPPRRPPAPPPAPPAPPAPAPPAPTPARPSDPGDPGDPPPF